MLIKTYAALAHLIAPNVTESTQSGLRLLALETG